MDGIRGKKLSTFIAALAVASLSATSGAHAAAKGTDGFGSSGTTLTQSQLNFMINEAQKLSASTAVKAAVQTGPINSRAPITSTEMFVADPFLYGDSSARYVNLQNVIVGGQISKASPDLSAPGLILQGVKGETLSNFSFVLNNAATPDLIVVAVGNLAGTPTLHAGYATDYTTFTDVGSNWFQVYYDATQSGTFSLTGGAFQPGEVVTDFFVLDFGGSATFRQVQVNGSTLKFKATTPVLQL